MLLQDFGRVPVILFLPTSRYSSCNTATHLMCASCFDRGVCSGTAVSIVQRCTLLVSILSLVNSCCQTRQLGVDVNYVCMKYSSVDT